LFIYLFIYFNCRANHEPIILNGDAEKVSEMRHDGAPEEPAGESSGGGVAGASSISLLFTNFFLLNSFI
jgi:hypothetical protein